ncbi:ATP synthase F1 subunit epsilon [Sebaldella sp. S0638]|uniref:ATP synthase F1 subunit epsilon n=1 Tax=Sebaldella sp. S0638 TaxID=2957809 RepID=UPI00209CA20F|nr:ATP synthase F1 subunit epsilon [Sebaldella sp. S0638]MCP1223986.1 ATP synthase F1 subunit epsilon [Sebaldella sp. S0638]
MAKSFSIEAITPSGTAFSTTAEFLKLRTVNGDIGIMADHMPLVTELSYGEMIVKQEKGSEMRYYIDGGFMEVNKERVLILGDEIIESSQIDIERAQREKEIEESKLSKLKEEEDIAKANKKIQENLMKIKIGSR